MAALTDILNAIPWLVLLIVFVGGTWERIKLIGVLAATVERAQAGPAPGAASVPAKVQPDAPAPAKPVAVPPAPPPAPTGPFADYPIWFQWGLKEIGFHETGDNQGIERYITLGHTGSLGQPWCAIFMCAALEATGVPSTRSPSSQSFANDARFVKLSGPAKGCIVVFWRISRSSGQGHVGMYAYEDASRIWTLGGNEDNMVQIEALPKDSASFGFVGYYWPASIPLPQIGAVPVPGGTPTSIQRLPSAAPSTANPNPVQTSITATVFGSQENDNRQTAYGTPLQDNVPGVALPFHFPSPRPRVRVTNAANGKSVDCDIADVGPWNIKDPYWQTGARPQAESGFDLGQTGSVRKTNKAGIDLTIAAANAIGVEGKGLVNWQFIDAPSIPNVV